MTNFSVGDLLVFNRNVEGAPAARNGNTISNGIIISIDRERMGIRWTCYNGGSFKNHYTWHRLEEMICRKTFKWYPV